jgi:hypothetical protein
MSAREAIQLLIWLCRIVWFAVFSWLYEARRGESFGVGGELVGRSLGRPDEVEGERKVSGIHHAARWDTTQLEDQTEMSCSVASRLLIGR